MREATVWNAKFTLGLAKLLLKDIPTELMAELTVPNANNPAWVTGHLANTADTVAAFVGKGPKLAPSWPERYRGGTTPSPKLEDHPSKDELIAALEDAIMRLCEGYLAADEALLASELEDERRRARFGTHGQLISFVLTSHVAFHMGQVSTWRRAAGLGSAM